MKRFTLVTLICLAAAALLAQTPLKKLTIEEAILGTQDKLAVKRLSGLAWMGESSRYCLVDSVDGKVALVMADAEDESYSSHLLLTTFNDAAKEAGTGSFRHFPRFDWLSAVTANFWKGSQYCRYDLENNVITVLNELPREAGERAVHKNSGRIAYTVDDNVWVALNAEQRFQVTDDGGNGIVNGSGYVHRSEFGIGQGMFWSEDGQHLAFYRKNESMVAEYPLVDLDSAPATLRNTRYPMAGQTSEEVSVVVYDCATGSKTVLETGQPVDQYLTSVSFVPGTAHVLVVHLNRDQNHLQMIKYDAVTGAALAVLFEERDKEWVEPGRGPLFVSGGTDFIWLSKRDGFNNAYLYSASGKLKKQLTRLRQDITSLNGFSQDHDLLYFHAATEDGLGQHAYQVSLRKAHVHQMTHDAGVHRADQSGNGHFVLDQYNSIKVPNRALLLDDKGTVLKELLNAPNNLEGYAIGEAKLLTVKADDGTPLMARMILPPDFDASQKYPAVVYVYGGPHGAMVRDSWISSWQLWYHYMAQRGYIIFSLDNRGTNNRGVEFEQVIHRRLGTVEVADQMAGVNYLKSLDYVDGQRLGVHGWSYGGFMTLSLLGRHPDVFKAGVAGGPVTDWKFYEVMYGERYMDTPQSNPEGYRTASPMNYVDSLKAKTLIIHGCVDPVVVWQNSLTYLRKAIDADKLVDYFVYPANEHNMRGHDRVHLYTMISEYFFEHL